MVDLTQQLHPHIWVLSVTNLTRPMLILSDSDRYLHLYLFQVRCFAGSSSLVQFNFQFSAKYPEVMLTILEWMIVKYYSSSLFIQASNQGYCFSELQFYNWAQAQTQDHLLHIFLSLELFSLVMN